MINDALYYLKKYFGYKSFRPGQEEIINHILNKDDCLVLMPTGGGKSICYQIPAIMRRGCAIVVSPLIALMVDQVEALKANGIAAETINSFNSENTNREILEKAFKGAIKILYISPERLLADIDRWHNDFNLSMIAIDEAHCISQWGHDFRPVYTSLARIRDHYPDVPIMALTATADLLTRDDIVTQLRMKSPYCHIGSFDRPNISLKVMPDPGKKKRIATIRSLVERYPNDCGIVYCLSRKTTEDIAETLNSNGISAECYHAGMSASERSSIHQRFVNGELNVICATVAFGMGIDKSNIRWVVHNNLPANIESYYQEIGRAGRDGLPAEAIMFYNYGDIIMRESLISESENYEVFHEKLDRIKQFAESTVCRRRILLSYFSEETNHDCGNCDICRNPPVRIDGTVAAQKAMSAIIRTDSSIGLRTLVDILRGSLRAEIIERNLHMIKTFGAGRKFDAHTWRHYISQMIELGLIGVAYDRNSHLWVTPYGKRVLYGEENIMLSTVDNSTESITTKRKNNGTYVPTDPVQQLVEQLKKLRRKVAVEERIPDYILFSDATLLDMAQKRPTDIESFRTVNGVGEMKAIKYWRKFVGAIRKFEGLKSTFEGATYQETLILHNSNRRPTDIAKIRNLKLTTVYDHIAKLVDDGLINDFERLITPTQYNRVLSLRKSNPENWYSLLEEEMPVGLWKIALAIERRGGI